jgi:hypothetical protein
VVSYPSLPGNILQVVVPESPYNPIFSPKPWISVATAAIPFGHFVLSGLSSPFTLDIFDHVSSVLMYSYPTAFNPKLTNALAAVRAEAAEDGRPEFQLLNPIAGVTPTPLDSRGRFQAGEAPDNPTKPKLKTRFCIYIVRRIE